MTFSYRLSNEAKEDLRRTYVYGYQQFGVEQADRYFHNFFIAFAKITANPYLYHTVDHIRPNYKRCPCQEDSIYYRINGTVIEIMAIIGGLDTEEWV